MILRAMPWRIKTKPVRPGAVTAKVVGPYENKIDAYDCMYGSCRTEFCHSSLKGYFFFKGKSRVRFECQNDYLSSLNFVFPLIA